MRTEEKIRALLAHVEKDDRLKQPPANIHVNAPLALVQLELETKRDLLRWILS